ncbi:HemK2/MTQ2 family protein methyltransferase [Nocardia camponoti]|uniref:Methyltransferase n=1 Tax=Nocardia camponoti TaxID=1616106 RepID=A0A917Q772_9NOCA|nr:HemK2/MTQ2 family protein methyltransferase [Nocardia camponoti]GGK32766.1 methyltransferase [Nocardia camponoti]
MNGRGADPDMVGLPIIRAPRVYPPQADTWLLRRALCALPSARGLRVLDAFAGTGALTLAAAANGARTVTAIDRSRPALLSTWANCRLRGISVELIHGDFTTALGLPRFDLVLANPPYVPAARDGRGAGLAWDAGQDGRRILDRLCAVLPSLLTPQGMALIVHSTISDPHQTLNSLRDNGVHAHVVAKQTIPFGPVMRSRVGWLAAQGHVAPGQRHEELVVIRVDNARVPAARMPASRR